MTPDLSGYVTVTERLRLALDRHPDLRVQCAPPSVIDLDGRQFIQVTVTVWRTPDDPLPAVATAWEPFPGRSPFTRDSEMMNAETSALGRALGLLGVGIAGSLASSDEVLARKGDAAHAPASAAVRPHDGPDQPARAQMGSRRPSPDKPATDAQVQLLRKMAAERGIELGDLSGLSAADASAEIGRLREQAAPR